MVRGQTVAQPHCQFQRLLIVHCFESSTPTHQYTITGQRHLLLSDKLLGCAYVRVRPGRRQQILLPRAYAATNSRQSVDRSGLCVLPSHSVLPSSEWLCESLGSHSRRHHQEFVSASPPCPL